MRFPSVPLAFHVYLSIPSRISLPILFAHLYFSLGLIPGVHAVTNVTVDDQSPQVVYTPPASWQRISDNSTAVLDYDGGHMLTSDPAATAVFTFSGTAIYFLSARWPYAVSTAVALDGGPAVIIDLSDHTRNDTAGGGPATIKSAVVASAIGLRNVSHTLTVSVGAGQTFAVVDGFIYTELSSSDHIPSSSSGNITVPTQLTPVPQATTTSPSTKTAVKKNHALAIALPIIIILAIILALLVFWWFRRHRKDEVKEGNYPFFPGTGGARTMRTAFTQDGVEETNVQEGVNAQTEMRESRMSSLRVTNPDPFPESPASMPGQYSHTGMDMPGAIAMPVPVHAGDIAGVGSQDQDQRASHAPPSASAASAAPGWRTKLHRGAHADKAPARAAQTQSQTQSPRTLYGALRALTASPTRAYPVPPPPARGSKYATRPSTRVESGGAYVESFTSDDTLPLPPPPRGGGAGRAGTGTFTPSWVRPATMDTTPRSPTTVYSQVTALGLEEDEFARMHAHESAYGGAGDSHEYGYRNEYADGHRASAANTSGLHGASRRSRVSAAGKGTDAEGGGWGYLQTPLAYVPVFKS